MASEYYKKKFQDVEPEKPYEMTRQERWKNWWYYHWSHVLIIAAIVGFLGFVTAEFIFRERPDHKVAYVGMNELPVSVEYLQKELAALGTDRNGDGEVVVQIRTYMVGEDTAINDNELVPLVGDLGIGNSTVFILEDPQWFMQTYGVTTEENSVLWSECPALSFVDLGEYTVALRTTDDLPDDYVPDTELWQAITAGAE